MTSAHLASIRTALTARVHVRTCTVHTRTVRRTRVHLVTRRSYEYDDITNSQYQTKVVCHAISHAAQGDSTARKYFVVSLLYGFCSTVGRFESPDVTNLIVALKSWRSLEIRIDSKVVVIVSRLFLLYMLENTTSATCFGVFMCLLMSFSPPLEIFMSDRQTVQKAYDSPLCEAFMK